MSKVCHPERRAKPEVEGSSHQISSEQMASAKILRLALLAQDDKQVAAVRGNDVFFLWIAFPDKICYHILRKLILWRNYI